MLLVTLVVVLLFGVPARLIGGAVRWFDRLLDRQLPGVAAHVVVAVVLGNKLVVDALLGRAVRRSRPATRPPRLARTSRHRPTSRRDRDRLWPGTHLDCRPAR